MAYSTWFDTVQIEGTIHMGSATIGLTELTCVEKYRDPDTGLKVDGEWLGKDVGRIECRLEDLIEDPHTGKLGYKKAIVDVIGAYPSYQVHIIIAIGNLGTLPVHFVNITITGFDVTDNEILIFEWLPSFGFEKGVFKNDVDGDGDLEDIINVDIVNFVCHQLDPCHDTKGEVDLHFKQDAEECHTYTFKVEIVAVQWNEA
jgi:hypothetical protein